jgi:predicted oxidoreductase
MQNFCVKHGNSCVIATCVGQSPSFEAKGRSASEKVLRILWYSKVREPWASDLLSLSWARWIQSVPSHPLSLRSSLYYLLIYVLILKKWHRTFRFSHQNPVWTSPSTCLMPSPSHPLWFDPLLARRHIPAGAWAASLLRFLDHMQLDTHSVGLL